MYFKIVSICIVIYTIDEVLALECTFLTDVNLLVIFILRHHHHHPLYRIHVCYPLLTKLQGFKYAYFLSHCSFFHGHIINKFLEKKIVHHFIPKTRPFYFRFMPSAGFFKLNRLSFMFSIDFRFISG